MAWNYGFFNSVNGDRTYNANQLSHIFEGLITDGVYEAVGNKLAVQPNNGMTIKVASGRGWFNKRWVSNDTDYPITIEASDVTLNRYAAICIRVDDTDSVRSAVPYIKYSNLATNPVKPTMIRSEKINEYCLAYVFVRAKATAITAADIEDTRQDASLCGWVTGLIEQITPDTLYTQFTAMFNDWFNGLVSHVNTNTETMLVNATPATVTLNLAVSNWVAKGDKYEQTVSVLGMTPTKVVMVSPASGYANVYDDSGCSCVAQGVNSVTISANKLPDTAIKVDVIYLGV